METVGDTSRPIPMPRYRSLPKAHCNVAINNYYRGSNSVSSPVAHSNPQREKLMEKVSGRCWPCPITAVGTGTVGGGGPVFSLHKSRKDDDGVCA